ncbi:hypothetical protein PLANPX_2639 [Lacipirellula parvula]|uniref:Uncharacterized protein n=1 Tax=Lacipirellula parvula TaxID=2650471 RepID=A0A5K7XAN6_9BACT|nr:hypothetical protein PLANPX_2639 [Lacipirellula parvula]
MPASVHHRRAFTLIISVIGCWCALAATKIHAQRVQFPSSVAPASPFAAAPSPVYPATPQPSLTPAIQSFDPYAAPGMAAPPIDVPYSAPALTPNFGAAPPTVTPYGMNPATVAPPMQGIPYAPPPNSNILQNMPTVQWNRGTYDYTNPDGSTSRLQRFMQQLTVESTYLMGNHNPDQLAWNRLEMAATFGVPIFRNPDTPLLITPGFAFNWLEGPSGPNADLPPRVYDAYLDTAWSPKLTERLSADLGFRTGVWSDFSYFDSRSMRFMGRGLGVYTLSPKMDVHAGVWYLDRNKVKILPAGGVYWRPNPEWDLWLLFPNPKIRKRFQNLGQIQWWWYVAGEYGGGAWTITRSEDGPADGARDDIDYNDIRVMLGLEWETQTRLHGHAEIGYVFDREIVYSQTNLPPEYNLDDTIMFRLGFDF